METILRDLQEECRRLGEEAAKKIEEKYVGKGAVILSEVHELDKNNRKARIKHYTILKPDKIYSDVLTLQSDSKFNIKIFTYTNCGNEPTENKVFIVLRYQKCEYEYHRVIYNDTIRFVDKRTIDELLKEIKSSIPSDSVILSPFDNARRIKYEPNALQLKEGESIISLDQYLNQLKKELEDYVNE